jgi:hypothetical protein
MPFPLYFKTLPALAVVLGVTACTASRAPEAPPPVEPAISACDEPRPQVCTMIYAPVCASHADGRVETHASACNACADDTVATYVDGACEEEPSAP